MIPGVREDQEMRQRRSRIDKALTEPFFIGLKSALRDKHFVGYMALFVAYTSTMGLVMATIPFFVQDILQLSKIGETIVLFYVAAVIISAPIWYKISFKIGIKKVALIGICLLACMGLPLLFVPTGPEGLLLVIIIFSLSGFVDGAMPLFSSVVDNATIESGKRQEGLYNGIWMFFSRVSIAIRAIVFLIVSITFGYHSGSTDPYALMGLRFQMSVFPMIICSFGIYFFWRLYKITPEQLEFNVEKIKELKL